MVSALLSSPQVLRAPTLELPKAQFFQRPGPSLYLQLLICGHVDLIPYLLALVLWGPSVVAGPHVLYRARVHYSKSAAIWGPCLGSVKLP